MAMVDLKLPAKDRKATVLAAPEEMEGPEYPYGCCIHLDDDTLTKLGVTTLPAVGASMPFTAKAVVKSTSEHASDGGEKRRSVELQIVAMELSGATPRDAASTLYDKD